METPRVLYFAAPVNLVNFAFLALGGVPSTSKQESSLESDLESA